MSKSASLPWLRFSIQAGADELPVMHNVAAMVDIERAAFFAARSQGADLSLSLIHI